MYKFLFQKKKFDLFIAVYNEIIDENMQINKRKTIQISSHNRRKKYFRTVVVDGMIFHPFFHQTHSTLTLSCWLENSSFNL